MKRIIPFVLFLISGCKEFAIERKVVGNYYLIATDHPENSALSYKGNESEVKYGTIIGATVYAVGYNENFIVAKQHPKDFSNPLNRSITNYYILPLKENMDWRTNNGLIGPLTKTQFEIKRQELSIPTDLKFTQEIEYLK